MKKIAVMSGKGGVGKSSVCILLSLILSEKGKVLILDFDVCGPSCVSTLAATGDVMKAEKGLVPVQISENLYLLSMGLMIKSDDAVIWRGPKKIQLLQMFYESIDGFEYVLCDMPPGISEEHEFLVDKHFMCVHVTTSQNVALRDTAESIDFCSKSGIQHVGIIENMSGYQCECCGDISNVFAAKGGSLLAESLGIPFLCSLPVEKEWCVMMDEGTLLQKYKKLSSYKILKDEIEKNIM